MKHICYSLIICSLLWACGEEEDLLTSGEFWMPTLTIETGESELLIRLLDYRKYLSSAEAGLDPRSYRIMTSTDNRNFTEIDQVDASHFENNSVYESSIDNPEEGLDYYVRIEAIHSSEVKQRSEVASAKYERVPLSQLLFPDLSSELQYSSISYSKNFFSFVTFNPETRRNRLNVYNAITDENIGRIENPFSNFLLWSYQSDRLIYQLADEQGGSSDFKIMMYDAPSNSERVISESLGFSVSSEFSRDDRFYYHMLIDNNLFGLGGRTLWQYDIANDSWSEKWKFEFTEVYENQSVSSFSNDAVDYYFRGTSSVTNRDAFYRKDMERDETHFVTAFSGSFFWPKISPDNRKIAFVSDKTGRFEVWTYDLFTHEFKQITNSSRYDELFSSITHFSWISDEEIVAVISENSLHQKEDRLIITARVPN
ncbi:MAG: hypothetical protein AAFQ94_22260 [Bacteroidota bacterium]